MTDVEIMGKITSRKHSRGPDEPAVNGVANDGRARGKRLIFETVAEFSAALKSPDWVVGGIPVLRTR